MKQTIALLAGAILCALMSETVFAANGPATPPLFKTPPTEDQLTGWIDQNLDLTDWIVIDSSDTDVLMLSDRPSDRSTYPIVKDWLKLERYRDRPGAPPRSSIWRVVVNCRDKTSKTSSIVFYSGNNGRGAVMESWSAPSYEAFEEHAPGTLGESWVEAICKSAEEDGVGD